MFAWRQVKRFFLSDEEMGKKDDDHVPSTVPIALRKPQWAAARPPKRRFLKRLALALLLACLVYLFIHNIPDDLGPHHVGRPHYDGVEWSSPPRRADAPAHTYNGPPKFLELAGSLRGIASTRGQMVLNKNILFAAASLKSAATLLPIACQMGRESRNYVHFAFMGRSQIVLKELASVNGIDESCQIIFHDARTEKADIMTGERIEYSTFRAFHHIHTYMHPQATFVDASGREEHFFTRAAASHARATGNTVIELPPSPKNLLWLTKLDSRSLHAWNKNHIDILIQATPGVSGSLIRLLRSLSRANFAASFIPHLTIELPHDVDRPTIEFLKDFQWPPVHIPNPSGTKLLTMRHRIPRKTLTEEESSARFLESFWPANPQYSHVLVLSPQVELAPNFFHYLKYTLLEYRYSEASGIQHWDARLFGISLEQPLKQLNGKDELEPPLSFHEATQTDVPSSFLWQAPHSNAMLFMGDKWMELHDFASRSLEVRVNSKAPPPLLTKKLISTRQPSWLEHALWLSKLRGYWTLYPGEDTAKTLATVHTDLYQPPEEYAELEEVTSLDDEATEEQIAKSLEKLNAGAGSDSAMVIEPSLQNLLDAGALRPFGKLPLLSWDGRKTDLAKLDTLAAEYASEFSTQVGMCGSEERPRRVDLSTRDLFCETE